MESKSKPKILVTGASGMLGLEVVKFFSKKGFKVIALYYSRIDELEGVKNVIKLKTDITGSKFIKIMSGYINRGDIIIHCAGMTEVNKCELNKKECFSVNVIGTRNVVKLAEAVGAKFIYFSTPFVFDGKKGCYREDQSTHPLNYYAKTKLLGEQISLRYKNSLVIRANPIGIRPIGAHPNFIQWFVDVARNNKSFTLFSDVFTNPISTKTLVATLFLLVADFKRGILHLGSLDVVNKAEIWDYIVNKFPNYSGTVVRVSIDDTDAGKIAIRPKNISLDTRKAKRLGFSILPWKKEVKYVLSQMEI